MISKRNVSNEIMDKFLPREVAILNRMYHQNILRIHHMIETDNHCFIVQELASNGDLFDYLQARKGPLLEREARFMLRQMCWAVSYCHGMDIAHRDIKCDNIMLDQHMNIKLGGKADSAWVCALKCYLVGWFSMGM